MAKKINTSNPSLRSHKQDEAAKTKPRAAKSVEADAVITPANFDPDAAAAPGTNIFGLPFRREDCAVILTPVPFDATVSYGHGTAHGPEAMFEASMQVDLTDPLFGPVYRRGIFMDRPDPRIAKASKAARALAKPIIDRGGAEPRDAKAVAKVEQAGGLVVAITRDRTEAILSGGKVAGLVGGDHSTPLGAIQAAAEFARTFKQRLGILHFDAHMDLRDAFEGFKYSHASIMFNVLGTTPNLNKLVQVGIRDYGRGEADIAKEEGERVDVWYDHDLSAAMLDGGKWSDLCQAIIKPLPEWVYISFDIDALDPALCPHTGTPVPGGLAFNQAALLMRALKASGRRVIGFDLVEVCPGPDVAGISDEWDANVGARVLYKLCGTTPDSEESRG